MAKGDLLMRYFVSSMALSKPIWSFCTMPNMLISCAIAVRTERRGRSLRSAQKRVSVVVAMCA